MAFSLAGPVPATTVRQLVEITDFSDLSASPDGRHVVFRTERANIARNSYDLEWYELDPLTGRVAAIGSAGDPIYDDPGLIRPGAPMWLGEDAFGFSALVDGAIGLWKAPLAGSGIEPLVVRDANVEDPSLSPDKASIMYKLGPSRDQILRAERDEYDQGVLVDGSVDLGQNLYRGGSIDGRMATQRLVGYWFVRRSLLWKSPRQQWRYDIATGREEPVGPPQAATEFKPPEQWRGEPRVTSGGDWAEAKWDGDQSVVQAQLAGMARPVRCTAPLCSGKASWLQWIPGSRRLLVAFTDGNRRQRLATWEVASGEVRELVSSDGLLSGGRSASTPCALTSTTVFCVSSAAASPPKLEAIDLAAGARKTVFDPNAELRSGYSPEVQQLAWSAAGKSFYGTLLRPRASDGKRLPLFINFYKCDGFLRGGEGDAWPIPALLDSGFAVACVNSTPIVGAQDAVADMKAALSGVSALVGTLGKRGLIDPERVGMGGFSHGSEVTTWIAMHSSLLAAVSISSTQEEPSGYWLDVIGAPDRAKTKKSVWHLGAPDETPSQWKLQSPALNTDHLKAPILFEMPEQEARRIPELIARLYRSATPAELYAFPDEDHLVVQPRHQAAIYSRNLDWFRYWLQSAEDPDPSKQAQYERWGALRRKACSAPKGSVKVSCAMH